MSEKPKGKVIHVDKLIINANEVQIISDRKEDDRPRRHPWDFFWGRRDREEFERESSDDKRD